MSDGVAIWVLACLVVLLALVSRVGSGVGVNVSTVRRVRRGRGWGYRALVSHRSEN